MDTAISPGSAFNPFHELCAALFDLDGTLIETHIDFAQMKRETLALVEAEGLGGPGWRALDVLGIVEGVRKILAEERGEEAGARFRTKAFAMLERIEVEQCAAPVEIAGAEELLGRLRERGVPVAIVTRNCRRVAEALIRRGRLPHDLLLSRDDVPLTKPHPSHLLTALARLGFTTLDTRRLTPAVMVGDHFMDVQAGRAAGIRTVGVLRSKPASAFDCAVPDLLVREVSDLFPLLGPD